MKVGGIMGEIKRVGSLLLFFAIMSVLICTNVLGAAAATTGVSPTPVTTMGTSLNPVVPVTPTPVVIQQVKPVPVQVNPDIINLKPWPVIIYPEKNITIKHKQPCLLEFTITKQPEYYRVHMDFGDGFLPQNNPVDVVETKYENNKYHISILCKSYSGYKSYDKATIKASAVWDWDNNSDSTDTISQPFKASGSWNNEIKTVAGNNCVTLSWDPVVARPGRVLYVIERRASENDSWGPITDFAVTGNTYTDNTAVNNVWYEYRVSAKIGQSVRQIYTTKWAQAKGGTLVMTVGSTTIKLNGVEKQIDAPPVIVNGRTFVPIRALVENIGGTIGYDQNTKQITIQYLGKTIVMQIGQTNATVNGAPVAMAVPPYISDEGRTMIPLRFVLENLGLNVYWNDADQSITVNF